MKKTGLELLVGMVRRNLLVRGFSTTLAPDPLKRELLKMQQALPDMAVETISMIQPDKLKNAFFFRIRRQMGEAYENYELYAGGYWYGIDLFKPVPWAFGMIESYSSRKYIADRIGEGLNMLGSFFCSGDAGLRPYERKRIKIVGGSQDSEPSPSQL